MRDWTMGLVALGLGSVIAFAALEIGVRLFVDVDAHRAIEVSGVDPKRPIGFLPGSSHVYETSEFRYRVDFNRFGRRDVEWDAATIADPGGILLIGDSFVLGNGLEHDQAIPTRLEDLLGGAAGSLEVFNFGMPGGGPPQYAQLLDAAIEDGFAAHTVVVMIFVGNDFYPSVIDDPNFDPVEIAERQVRPPAPAPSGFRSELVRFVRFRLAQSPVVVSAILTFGKWTGMEVYSSPSAYIFQREQAPEQERVIETILGSIREMKRRCDAASRQLLLVAMPNRIQVENSEALTSATLDPAAPNRRLEELCDDLAMPCLDLLPVLRAEYERSGEGLYFPIDRHLTPAGSEFAASSIARFLKEKRAWKNSN